MRGSTSPEVLALFSSYKGTGLQLLKEIRESLQSSSHKIPATLALEYTAGEERTSLRRSFQTVDECGYAVFIFFSASTIDVNTGVEGLDQAIIMEFMHLWESSRDIPMLFVFDSEYRWKAVCDLLHCAINELKERGAEVTGTEGECYIDYQVVDAPNEDLLKKKIVSTIEGFYNAMKHADGYSKSA